MKKSVAVSLCVVVALSTSALSRRTIQFTNRCGEEIWVSPLTNSQGDTLSPGIKRLQNGASYRYNISDDGWGGRFWPKMGCDSSGNNCQVGQSVPPCPRNGCDPPAETKIEFYFPKRDSGQEVWYGISLVDGYSLAAEVIPNRIGGKCRKTNCALSLNSCPRYERGELRDLRVSKNGNTVMCLSPCKKWSSSSPFGMGRSEQDGDGRWYCCPTPPVQPGKCRRGIVSQTEYAKLVHRDCPTAYAYVNDDEAGHHNCPNEVSFQVNFC